MEDAFVACLRKVDYMLVVADDLWDDSAAITKGMPAMIDINLESSDGSEFVSARWIVELVS